MLFAIGCSLCAASGSAKIKDEKLRPLRFPFALVPEMSPGSVKAQLKTKGLVYVREEDAGDVHLITWKLSHQIQYGTFAPQFAVAAFQGQKLVSWSMKEGPIDDCSRAQTIYQSALDFVRVSYDPKDAPVTEEPAEDVLDCGPHFKPEDYRFREESKKIVLIVAPTLQKTSYEIGVTYYSRPHMKLPHDPEAVPETPKKSPQTDQNL